MKIITIPCAFDNYAFLIICEKTSQAGVVDPAEFYPVWTELENQGVELTAILCTHNHMDHTGGNAELLEKLPDLKVYGHQTDKGSIPGQNVYLKDSEKFAVGDLQGSVIHSPGHTLGSVSYLFEDAMFTGDTLFASGCGRVFEGTPEQMYDSLNEKIAAHPPETSVYFGHEYTLKNLEFALTVEPGNIHLQETYKKVQSMRGDGEPTAPTTLGSEKQTNPFLRSESQEIKETVKQHDPGNDLLPASVFRVIRQLKDQF
jgi:hydroxyacylglutathione hydrolase